MKIKTIIGILGSGAFIVFLGYGRMKIDDWRDLQAIEKFDTLRELADVDSDGKLSKLEKELLIERLNANTYYPNIKWTESDLKKNSGFGLGYQLKTIEEVIKKYRK